MRFSRTRYSVTRRGVEDSLGEIKTPFFEYTSRDCIVSKRISAWARRRFPNFGPPRPKCPSIARMLTILGGVTSECKVHRNTWFGELLDFSKPCRWPVYGFVVSFLIVLTSPSANARYTWRYVVTAIRRRGATHAVSFVEFTWNIPKRRAFGVSTSGNERAFANRYMLKMFLKWFPWLTSKLFTRVLNDSGVVVAQMTGSGTWRSNKSVFNDQKSTSGLLSADALSCVNLSICSSEDSLSTSSAVVPILNFP